MKLVKRSPWAAVFTVLVVLGITPLASADTSTDKTSAKEIRQETQEMLEALKTYTADQRDEASRKIKTSLEDLDKRIEALEARVDKEWDQMDKTARQKARAGLRRLRQQRNQVAEWYGGLKSSSAKSWEQVKEGFSEAYKGLHDSWEKAKAEFGSQK